MITQITKVYTREYRDNGMVRTYVEWIDARGRPGRTEGDAENAHMRVLMERGAREGIEHTKEIW